MMSGQTADLLVIQLKTAGLRVTHQRLAIYSSLVASASHPTAGALFQQLQPDLPSLSQATVYNTLQALVECGLVQKIGEAGDGSVHYDGNPRPHVNLVCTNCHHVDDVFDIPLDGIARQVAQRSGYRLQGMRIAYYGLCPRCLLAAEKDQPV